MIPQGSRQLFVAYTGVHRAKEREDAHTPEQGGSVCSKFDFCVSGVLPFSDKVFYSRAPFASNLRSS